MLGERPNCMSVGFRHKKQVVNRKSIQFGAGSLGPT